MAFRHRRELDEAERQAVFDEMRRLAMKRLDLEMVCVRPGETELIFRPPDGGEDGPFEFSDLIEKAKAKAGKRIIKKSGERWAPLGMESYDRIIRDEAEHTERWEAVLHGPVDEGLAEEPDEYPWLWAAEAPDAG